MYHFYPQFVVAPTKLFQMCHDESEIRSNDLGVKNDFDMLNKIPQEIQDGLHL